MTPVIEVKNLSKVYRISHDPKAQYSSLREDLTGLLKKIFKKMTGGSHKSEDFWALRNVSFKVERGAIVGIIGRNGAGKSTLLKILSRIAEPTSGEAILRGRVSSLLEVGTGFHPELTGRENIYLNGSLLGMTRREIDRRFDEIVSFAEVEKFLDTPVKFYSSGMYVRLAFAVAAHLDPEILIIDEVLSVGDAEFQRKSLGRMRDIASSGRTVLFVSHNIAAVKQLCDWGIILEHGEATRFGNVDELVSEYQRRTAPEYIGRDNSIALEKLGFEIKDFTINGTASKSNVEISSGEPITLSLNYSNKSTRYDIAVGYGIRVRKTGAMMVFTHNHLENVSHKASKSGQVVTKLEVPYLSPDDYSLEVSLWLDGNHCIDAEEIGRFKIPPVVFFPNGQTFTTHPAAVLVRSSWEFLNK